MDIYKYTAEIHMGKDKEIHHFTVNSLKYASPIHYHDFYEIFLIVKGSTIHVVNNEKQHLSEGSLVFIRPNDVHYYEYDGDNDCEFINICITIEALNKILFFIGDEFCPERLLSEKLPSCTMLSPYEKDSLVNRLEKMYTININESFFVQAQMKGIILDIFLRYFWQFQKESESNVPLWLESLLIQMQKRENFIAGISRLYELAGRSPGHINRVFKNYLSTTPIEYINILRLDYAKHLLLTTHLSVTDISLEVGFNNLSHFYHLFKKKYYMPPTDFRASRIL